MCINRNGKASRLLIVLLLISMVLLNVPSAYADESDTGSKYGIILGAEGLESGYDALDEEVHSIGDQAVNRTYVILLRDETFTMTNDTGSLIQKTGIRLINGSSPSTATFTKGGKRDASYLSSTVKVRFTDKTALAEAGYTNLDEEADAFYYLYFTSVDYAVLIQITPNGTADPVKEARDALGEQIAYVTGDNADNYYQTDDRFNGKATSENGFWADLQEPLSDAQSVYGNADASIDEINDACTALIEAIDNLIPVIHVNPTELYETINTYKSLLWDKNKAVPGVKEEGEYVIEVEESNTGTVSWAAYQSAMTKAQNLLASLFDKFGNPTSINDSSNEELTGELAKSVSNIIESVRSLEPKADKNAVMDAEISLAGIDLYANILYNTSIVDPSRYTEDTYTSYVEARNAAIDVADNTEAYSGMGTVTTQKCVSAFMNLRHACYALKEKNKTSIEVSFSAVDTYSLSRDVDPMYVNTATLILQPGATISDALAVANVTLSNLGELNERNGVFLNGIFLTSRSNFSSTPPESYEWDYGDYQLRDGDELTVIRFLPPWWINTFYYSEWLYSLSDMPEAVQYARIKTDETTKYAGTPFELYVEFDGALPTNYTGVYKPFSGARVYVSQVCASEDEARTAKIVDDTEAITDEQGRADVVLYESGWYAINILAPGDGNCLGCQTVIVHVENAKDLDAIKSTLITALDITAEKYDEDFYKSEDWQTINQTYQEALLEIESASSSGDAKRVQKSALKTIRTIQKQAEKYNYTNLSNFRESLGSLPDAAEKLDQSANNTIAKLQSYYDQMTVYQSNQLTLAEEMKYESIIDLYTSGLPEAREYSLSFEVKMDGGSEEDLATLSEMLDWINANNGKDDVITDITGGDNLPNVNTFGISNKTSWNFYENIESSTATQKIYACISPDQAIYLRVRDAGGEISGDGWSINDRNIVIGLDDSMNARLYKKMIYTINGRVYEIKDVSVEGLDTEDYVTTDLQFFDTSTYKEKDKDCVNLSFPDSFLRFNMPFNDVKVIVTWRPVVTSSADLSVQKTIAEKELLDLYNTYDEQSYTSAVWDQLSYSKDAGIAGLEASTTEEELTLAKKEAVEGMLIYGSTSNMIGMDNIDIPDYGDVVGRVYISFENTTWGNAPEPFHGTFVSGWYDLCENDTMMTSILKALAMEEPAISWLGTGGSIYDIGYLSTLYIDGNDNGKFDIGIDPSIGEFDNGNLSGWMGTLNDWFTNFGFPEFSYTNGRLNSGDVISIRYSSSGAGADIGGTWGNSDTTLSALSVSEGTIEPAFDSNVYDYTLTIPDENTIVKVTSTANNKNYQVRTFLNYYDNDDAYYKPTQSLVVNPGDVIYVGCGEYHWPSMNNQETESRTYSGTKYTIKVVTPGSPLQVEELIDNIRTVKYSNYTSVRGSVENARTAYDALSDEAKNEIDPSLYNKLTDAEQLIVEYVALDAFKDELSQVDIDDADDETANGLVATYVAMTDNQKRNLTTAEKNKVEALRYEVTYEWSEDHDNCTARAINRYDSSDSFSETAAAKVLFSKQATCQKEGEKKVKATFENRRFKAQTVNVMIPKLDHDPGKAVTENEVAPTCVKDGSYDEVFYCTVCGEEISRETKTVSAVGHKYCEPAWTWAEDNTSAAATFTCSTCEDKQTVEATVTSVTKEPTCTEEGETVYTATAAFGEKNYTDTKTITIAAKGHAYEEVTVRATLTEDGYIENRCTVCGEVKSKTVISHPKTFKLAKSTYVYDGKAKKPAVTVKDAAGNVLVKDKDYTVKYASGRKKIGIYNVTITMKDDYSGSKSLTFIIKPAKVKGLKLTSNKKNQLKVTYTKSTGGVKYQLAYRIKGKKAWKRVTVKGASKVIKNLKAGKTYQVKVRAFKKVNGKTYYGAWCKVKTKKVKKA